MESENNSTGNDVFTEEELLDACRASGYNVARLGSDVSTTSGVNAKKRGNTKKKGNGKEKGKTKEQTVKKRRNDAPRQDEGLTVSSQLSPRSPPMSNASVEQDPEAQSLAGSTPSHRERLPGRSKWKQEIEKNKRMRGEEYLGFEEKIAEGCVKRTRTKLRGKRQMGGRCFSKNCIRTAKRSCSEFPEEERKRLFSEFWGMEGWESRKLYVRNHVDQSETKFRRNVEGSKRLNTYIYYLKLYGIKRQVCQFTFLSTLGLGRGQVKEWLKVTDKADPKKPGRKIRAPSQREIFASKFLGSLPILPSHYCRTRTQKLYLEPVYDNFTTVYNHYKQECADNNLDCYSWLTFRQMFKKTKLGIYQPKKDKCDLCSSKEAGNIDQKIFVEHRLRAETARAEKTKDKIQALEHKCHVLAVDVQAVLLCPVLTASSLYYKTKLILHNYTVYDLRSRHTVCFLWNESEADLTASVFATCLRKYITDYFHDDLPIIVYSDGCTNQNRNATLANALLDLAIRNKKVIIQKFLEKGHTQMEVDSVHATIERRIKGKEIFVPTDYIEHFLEARKNPFPYEVQYMKHSDFLNFSATKYQKYPSIRPGNKTG